MRILVLGYGNPGRLDDGLGPAFAERIQELRIPGLTADANYQLNVEDAAALAQHDFVLFADAALSGSEPFSLGRVDASPPGTGFTSHSLSASALLGLTKELFGLTPRAFLLAIRGYAFDGFGEGLSEKAASNLEAAVTYVAPLLRSGFKGLG